ncbi:MAG: bifunctional methionine sulfoxide reductase B/A protein [Planctomycetota bacterium]|nr:bifunctional methionine sulfoxide reductase B/A protein [Planctomycetota bacterium]
MHARSIGVLGVAGIAGGLLAGAALFGSGITARAFSGAPSTLDALLERDDASTKPEGPGQGSQQESDMKATKVAAEASQAAFSRSAFDITRLSESRVEELATKLTPSERHILLSKGTERPFCGTLLDNKKQGVYTCKLCDLPLFKSDDKFNSGTGWPSFFQPFDAEHIAYTKDASHGMVRVEITCARCDGHLGHVFDDGPKPTGLRYCLNSESLSFIEAEKDGSIRWPEGTGPIATEVAYFAGGCFWGVEDRFQQTPGVINSVSGYQGGHKDNPTYKEVCYSDTGHAETVMVTFDPKRVSYRQLLEKFFAYHNPTTLNRQGPDVGTQYRSAIFTANEAQHKEALAFIAEQQQTPKFKDRKIVTQVTPVSEAGVFYAAEEYHQDYHEKNGGHCAMPE